MPNITEIECRVQKHRKQLFRIPESTWINVHRKGPPPRLRRAGRSGSPEITCAVIVSNTRVSLNLSRNLEKTGANYADRAIRYDRKWPPRVSCDRQYIRVNYVPSDREIPLSKVTALFQAASDGWSSQPSTSRSAWKVNFDFPPIDGPVNSLSQSKIFTLSC